MKTIYSRISLVRKNLEIVQSLGVNYIGYISYKSSCGENINNSELQRILAYNEIKNLNKEDINQENINLIEEAIKWAAWIPKSRYIEKTEGCRHSKIFPDGSEEFVRMDFKK